MCWPRGTMSGACGVLHPTAALHPNKPRPAPPPFSPAAPLLPARPPPCRTTITPPLPWSAAGECQRAAHWSTSVWGSPAPGAGVRSAQVLPSFRPSLQWHATHAPSLPPAALGFPSSAASASTPALASGEPAAAARTAATQHALPVCGRASPSPTLAAPQRATSIRAPSQLACVPSAMRKCAPLSHPSRTSLSHLHHARAHRAPLFPPPPRAALACPCLVASPSCSTSCCWAS